MALTSNMLPLGTTAPDFSLPGIDGSTVAVRDFADSPALLVAFLCNHCPYVRHIEKVLGSVAGDFQERGVAVIGICPNDVEAYPDDDVPGLQDQATRAGWDFPYLVDESQEVAKAYQAACTPDFFLFDADRRLVYRGAFDETRPGGDDPTGDELRAAVDAVLAGEAPSADQRPSMGCGIKWKD